MNVLMSTYSLHQNWIKKYLEPHITPDSQVAIVPFSFHPDWIDSPELWEAAYSPSNGKYYREIVDQFTAYGISENTIHWLHYFKHTPEQMAQVIQNADIVFLTGGLPELAVNRIKEKQLEAVLKQHTGHIIGASAGALIQLPDFYVSPDADYDTFSYHTGLGLVNLPYYIEVHYEGSKIQDQCIANALNEKSPELYALGDQGAIILHRRHQLIIGDVTYCALAEDKR